jgi:hypothetical protein
MAYTELIFYSLIQLYFFFFNKDIMSHFSNN